jgi:hypothetical protein
VPLSGVLRVTRSDTADTIYRVVFIKSGQMRIAYTAQIDGSLTYTATSRFNTLTNTLDEHLPAMPSTHEWSELKDYTSSIVRATRVRF